MNNYESVLRRAIDGAAAKGAPLQREAACYEVYDGMVRALAYLQRRVPGDVRRFVVQLEGDLLAAAARLRSDRNAGVDSPPGGG